MTIHTRVQSTMCAPLKEAHVNQSGAANDDARSEHEYSADECVEEERAQLANVVTLRCVVRENDGDTMRRRIFFLTEFLGVIGVVWSDAHASGRGLLRARARWYVDPLRQQRIFASHRLCVQLVTGHFRRRRQAARFPHRLILACGGGGGCGHLQLGNPSALQVGRLLRIDVQYLTVTGVWNQLRRARHGD